jgi:D-3-phosphoglycerate dehydrogenase
MAEKCLFSAPFAFMPEIQAHYRKVVPTCFREIWRRDEVVADPGLTVWIPNPGQGFIIDDGVLDGFPRLTAIVTPSTGRNHIDLAACSRRGITVRSLLDDRAGLERISASAEFTFLLLMAALRRFDLALDEAVSGNWRKHEDDMRGHELDGRTVGLVGLGRIGRRMARYCTAFGADVAYCDPDVADGGYPRLPIEAIFRRQVVVVCCTLSEATAGMVGRDLLQVLPEGAVLVNTSRGEVIDESALAAAVEARPDLRVAVDVLAGEVSGRQDNSPLMKLARERRIIVSPHIAGATKESQMKAAEIACDQVAALLRS